MSQPATNPIGLDPQSFTEEDWTSEAHRASLVAERATHSQEDYLVAGIPSSQTKRSPSNFAWPVSEAPKRTVDYKNVHTEYRDNFHEWDFSQVCSSFYFVLPASPEILDNFRTEYKMLPSSFHKSNQSRCPRFK